MVYIIYDLEATCWPHRPEDRRQETIEIGAVRINRYGEITGTFNRFVRPIVYTRLSPFCRELTNITQTQVDRSSEFPEVIESFQEWAGVWDDEYLLCSWGSFDKKQFIRDCQLHNLEEDWVEAHVNLKRQYQEMKRLRHPAGLKKSVEREGFEFTGLHHRAISDAENLAKVFVKYLDDWVL